MPNREIFCSAPWFELHIYWDGGLGFCCQENHRIYHRDENSIYNIKNMSIQEWYDSEPMRSARMAMFGDQQISYCRRCYHEMQYSNTSRRHKSNQKVVIFTKSAFEESYRQSPFFERFEDSLESQGHFDGMPVDLHIDLGNYCNLACKMCKPRASSVIAAQFVKWGKKEAAEYIGTDWTRDDAVWNRVLLELASIKNLKNVHFMGGETLITSRFEQFVDFMIEKDRTDLQFSFVHNGTIYNQTLIDKLKKFRRVGIEISIETLDDRNCYQRQGTDNAVVMENLSKYLSQCDGSSITLTLRPAISALTVGSYHGLLEFALAEKLVVKSNLVYDPQYLDIKVLPKKVRDEYKTYYQDLIDRYQLQDVSTSQDYNESDPNQIRQIIKSQCDMVMEMLSQPPFDDNDQKQAEMVEWCQRWDKIYKLNARALYPELREMLDKYGYSV